jgi:hypothetical protein
MSQDDQPGADGPQAGSEDYAGTPRPDAVMPALDEGQLAALREIGREWDQLTADPQVWREALPVDPALGGYPKDSDFRPARFTRVVAVSGRDGQLPALETTGAAETQLTPGARFGRAMRRLLEGAPLDASALAVERMRKLVALPVLSADALSSVAYGPEAMLAVLVLAGAAGLSYSLPVGGAIMVMMLAVGVSYRQTIRAYPQGGGSYIVASEELGRVPGLVAAAGLLIDYILTVAVSVASGVAAITSAFGSVQPDTVWIGVGVIIALLAGNMRGVRQAGAVFAVPTYAFIAAMATLVIAGLVHAAGRGFHLVPARHLAVVQALSVLVVLRAFASGSTAITGIEAISNAVPSFKPVEWRNARITLSWMIALLIAMFAGVLVIARLSGVVPEASQTMLSQLAHLNFGNGAVYIYIQAATAAVLLMAANTSYNDFPRVLFLMARPAGAALIPPHRRPAHLPQRHPAAVGRRCRHLYRIRRQDRNAAAPLCGGGVPRVHPVPDRHDHALAAPPRPAALAPQPGLQRHRRAAVGHRVRRRGRHQVHLRRLGRHRPHRRDSRHLPAYSPVLRRGRTTTGPAAGRSHHLSRTVCGDRPAGGSRHGCRTR